MLHVCSVLLYVFGLLSVALSSGPSSISLEHTCPYDSWCEGGIRAACPVGTQSAANSTSLRDCVCKDGMWSRPHANSLATGKAIQVKTESIQRWDALHDGLQLRLGRPCTRQCHSSACTRQGVWAANLGQGGVVLSADAVLYLFDTLSGRLSHLLGSPLSTCFTDSWEKNVLQPPFCAHHLSNT